VLEAASTYALQSAEPDESYLTKKADAIGTEREDVPLELNTFATAAPFPPAR
jgi:hypothetical protein